VLTDILAGSPRERPSSEDRKLKKLRGFTLIELLIVVAIVAILAAIAYPSYQEHVRKTRRVQAKADLLEISQMLERMYTLNRSYASFDASTFEQSPRTGKKYYDITIDPLDATTYTITATPATPFSDPKCDVLSLNQLGVKTADGTEGTAGCW